MAGITINQWLHLTPFCRHPFKIVLECVFIVIFVIIVIVLARFNDLRGGFFADSINFESVQGKVTTSEIHWHTGSGAPGTTGYRLNIEYEYSVDGKKYTSKNIDFGPSSFREKQTAQDIVEKHPKDKEVTVYYEKENPNFAVLDTEINSNDDFIFAGSIFSSGILALLVLAIYHAIKREPKPTKHRKRKRLKNKRNVGNKAHTDTEFSSLAINDFHPMA